MESKCTSEERFPRILTVRKESVAGLVRADGQSSQVLIAGEVASTDLFSLTEPLPFLF